MSRQGWHRLLLLCRLEMLQILSKIMIVIAQRLQCDLPPPARRVSCTVKIFLVRQRQQRSHITCCEHFHTRQVAPALGQTALVCANKRLPRMTPLEVRQPRV